MMSDLSDFQRVLGPRALKAIKAVSLLEAGAAKRYETTQEEAEALISTVQDALDEVSDAYRKRFPNFGGESPSRAPAMGNSETSGESGGSRLSADSPGEALAIASRLNAAECREATQNTSSADPLRIPHWTQVQAFIENVPANQLGAYILHIHDRVYTGSMDEVSRQIAQKTG